MQIVLLIDDITTVERQLLQKFVQDRLCDNGAKTKLYILCAAEITIRG